MAVKFESVPLADLMSSGQQPAQLWHLWAQVTLHHTHINTHTFRRMIVKRCFTLMSKEIASLMKTSKFSFCLSPLHTAGSKLDLAALYLAYTNTHIHAHTLILPQQLHSCRLSTGGAHVVPMWLQPTCSVPDLVYICKKRHPSYSCTSQISHCLTRSVTVQANLSIFPLPHIVPINTWEAVWQPLRALQLQGLVKRKQYDFFFLSFSITDPWATVSALSCCWSTLLAFHKQKPSKALLPW